MAWQGPLVRAVPVGLMFVQIQGWRPRFASVVVNQRKKHVITEFRGQECPGVPQRCRRDRRSSKSNGTLALAEAEYV